MKHNEVPYCEKCRMITLPDTVHYCEDCHEASLASARAIMQKFVDKVDRGMARSIETYAETKQWIEEE